MNGGADRRNRGGNRRRGLFAPIDDIRLDAEHGAFFRPMTGKDGDCAQIGQADFMHRGFAIAHQEGIHRLALKQLPFARRAWMLAASTTISASASSIGPAKRERQAFRRRAA
jgi:hypothetical protein